MSGHTPGPGIEEFEIIPYDTAPEMLNALRDLLAVVDQFLTGAAREDAIAAARAAIAKAEAP